MTRWKVILFGVVLVALVVLVVWVALQPIFSYCCATAIGMGG